MSSDSAVLERPPAPRPAPAKSRRRISLGRGPWAALAAALLAAVLILPVLVFLLKAFMPGLLAKSGPLFSFGPIRYALSGDTLHAMTDSLFVSLASATLASVLGLLTSWITRRTNLRGARVWSISMWFLLLVPTYLTTEGWQRLLEPAGVLARSGFNPAPIYHVFFGATGVIFVLGMSGLPFAYLAVNATLANVGAELEDAARVHAASRFDSLRVVLPLLMPALLSAFAIVFAESMSDFGVAYTLAANAHFPIATYALYSAVDALPVNFPNAAAIGWLLVASALVPVYLQQRVTKKKSYAVVGGRGRVAKRVDVEGGTRLALYALLAVVFLLAVGVPLLGLISASFTAGLGTQIGAASLTLSNYKRVFSSTLLGSPLRFSGWMSMATATATIAFGAYLARMLAKRDQGAATKALDLLLIGSVALPGIVLGAGYIFSYNQPILADIGINLYGTSKLLFLGYLASALPATSRILVGPLAQVQSNMSLAARVHGATPTRAWMQTVMPILSRALLSAWLLTFAKTLMELPLSQLLYAPGAAPISVAINKLVAGYDYGGGTAMSVTALAAALVVIGIANGLYRLLAPRGWQRMGGMIDD